MGRDMKIEIDDTSHRWTLCGQNSLCTDRRKRERRRFNCLPCAAIWRNWVLDIYQVISSEAKVLTRAARHHQGVIFKDFPYQLEIVGSHRSGAIIELYTPWITYSLEALLVPTFSPNQIPSQARHHFRSSAFSGGEYSREQVFNVNTKSLVYQIICALEFLHGLEEPVGHRNIKPRNVLIDETRCVKLIDFGIEYQPSTSASSENL